MKFKLLHVRPHVWFFKQKETISKASSDDSSSEIPYVHKRSASLKLVKSDPSAGPVKLDNHPSHVSKQSSNSALQSRNCGKDVRVCTVVDAGCTCRATVASEHKQKKGNIAMGNSSKGDSGSLHDVCRPRWVQVFEAREDVGSIHDVCRPRRAQLNLKRATNASPPVGTSSSMVSRLVCKSSQDAVLKAHSPLIVEHCDVVCESVHDEGKTIDARASSYAGDEVQVGLDVHQLECRLRNAGLEERRRSSKKKNKYYEEGPSLSSGISSCNSTNTNTDSLVTCATTEMQDILLNANPAFDTDVLASNVGDNMLSLEELRASIAQRKLAQQASLGEKEAVRANGMRENVASSCSPASIDSGKIKVASRVSHLCAQSVAGHALEEVSVKHVDVGVNKKLCFSEYGDLSKQGHKNQSSNDKYCTQKEAVRDQTSKFATKRTSSRRVEASTNRGSDARIEVKKSIAYRAKAGLTKGKLHEAKREALEAERDFHESDRKLDLDFVVIERPICADSADDDVQGRALSSSCEIQVLSDYSYDPQSDGNPTYPMIRMHVNGTSPLRAAVHAHVEPRSSVTPAASHTQGVVRPLGANSIGKELMRSDSAVAMVKSSYDPKRDFKESMLEMVVAKRLHAPRQLQQLLQCYLSLNPSHYHPTIIKVFHELCSELFS